MSFSVTYYGLENSIQKAKRTARDMKDYASDIRLVASDCDKLPGKDPQGNVSTVARLAREKADRACKIERSFDHLARQLTELEDLAKQKDQSVETSIDVAVTNYVGKRSWLQKAGDFIYNMYINFLDDVSSIPFVGKYVAQGIRNAGNWISDTTTNIKNYFKYGEGKYIWNSVMAVAGAVGAVMGAVIAAAAVISAAPALVGVAIVGCVAACIYATTKFADAMVTVEENTKAFELEKSYRKDTADAKNWWEAKSDSGSITAARYYGNISGVKTYIDKTDFGGKTVNTAMDVIGSTYEFVQVASKITSDVCMIIVGAGNAQYLKGANGEWVKNASGEVVKKNGNFFQNIHTAHMEKLGYEYKRTPALQKYSKTGGKLTVIEKDYSKMFKLKFFEGYGKKLESIGVKVPKTILGMLNTTKYVSNTGNFFENIDDIATRLSGKDKSWDATVDGIKAGIDVFSNFEVADEMTKNPTKLEGVVEDVIDLFKPEENAYEAYLKTLSSAGGGGGGSGF